MINTHLENVWFCSIVSDPIYIESANPSFFKDLKYQEAFKIVKSFWKKYNQIPSANQVREIVKILKLEDKLPEYQVEAIFDINLNEYDPEWLRENTEAWIEWKNLEQSAMDSITYIKSTEVTPENIKDVVNTFKTIINDRNSLDFSFDLGLDFNEPENHKQPKSSTFSSGYDFIDLVLGGGFSAKNLYVLLGQPKVGKTLWLGNIAAQAVRASSNVAVITLELSDRKYLKRMGANLLGVKISEYNDTAEDSEKIKKKIRNLTFDNFAAPGQLFIKEFGTSQASVLDVEKYLRKVEEVKALKFKIVVIDYINIMKNWRNPNTENTYMKIKQIAEDLRAMGQRNGWAIVTATQTKQSEFDATDLSMNSASESSGLVATVDGMFGIIQDPLMYSNNEYKLKVLANRDEGYKNSYKKFNVDYSYMRISEDENSQIQNEN
jgi:KaiC/GvpD/RAD55 family RecA-like ATPase